MLWDKKLANYLFKSIEDYHADNDSTRFLRRLHMKEVHMQRRGNGRAVRIIKNVKEMM